MPNTNNRVFYAVHAVGIRPLGNTNRYHPLSGVQSVGINTTFNLEQVFQLGQLDLYENIENIPDVELTVEKVIDGRGLIQHTATYNALSTASGLSTRYGNSRSDVAIVYYADNKVAATGNDALAEVVCSGMYVNSINLSMGVDGNFTESVTFVGNDKFWATAASITSTGFAGPSPRLFNFEPSGTEYYNQGSPLSEVFRRKNLDLSTNLASARSNFPLEIPGVDINGAIDLAAGGAKIQSINMNVDLGRSELFALGQKGPYHRFAEFPTEVTCAIEVIEPEFGDFVNADSSGATPLLDQRISMYLNDGLSHVYRFNLGNQNKLSSVTSSGGDTGGGNRVTTYNYSNFNFFTITASDDPAGIAV